MRKNQCSTLLMTLVCFLAPLAVAQKMTTLYNFTNGDDGGLSTGTMVLDKNGALYGTTSYGGSTGCADGGDFCGTVFQLVPPVNQGGAWTENTLYDFGTGPNDGSTPNTGVVFDRQENLYGTTF